MILEIKGLDKSFPQTDHNKRLQLLVNPEAVSQRYCHCWQD